MSTAERGAREPGCCDEPDCRRRYPIGIYLADFSDRVFAATTRRVVRERGDGTATFAATGRHDVTRQVREFISRNPDWVGAVLDGSADPVARLRLIADQDIGGNAPWLADRLHALADDLYAEMGGEPRAPLSVAITYDLPPLSPERLPAPKFDENWPNRDGQERTEEGQ